MSNSRIPKLQFLIERTTNFISRLEQRKVKLMSELEARLQKKAEVPSQPEESQQPVSKQEV